MEGSIFCGLLHEIMINVSLINDISEEIKVPSDLVMMVLSDFWDPGGFFSCIADIVIPFSLQSSTNLFFFLFWIAFWVRQSGIDLISKTYLLIHSPPHQKKYLCVRNDSGVRSQVLFTAEAVGEATGLNSDEQSDETCTWNSWATQKVDDLLKWQRIMLSHLFKLSLLCLQNADRSENGKRNSHPHYQEKSLEISQ